MIEILEELRRLVKVLDDHGIDYALCGGMAMVVHGVTRTTIDIDLLILSDSLDEVYSLTRSLLQHLGQRNEFCTGHS